MLFRRVLEPTKSGSNPGMRSVRQSTPAHLTVTNLMNSGNDNIDEETEDALISQQTGMVSWHHEMSK